MAGVNKVILLGRLGQDPEIRYTQAGMAVCRFSLATSRKRKDGSEITAWHRCSAFNKSAELIAQYMSKGRQLFVEGELSYGQYEKEGVTHYTTDIIVNQFTFIDGKGGGAPMGGYQTVGPQDGFQGQGGGGYSGDFGGGPQGQGVPNAGGQQGYPDSGSMGPGQGGGPKMGDAGGMPGPPGGGMSDDDIPF